MTMTAYLVKVKARTIRTVQIGPSTSYEQIRGFIGCDRIDMVRIDRDHCIVVDDDGMSDELPCFTEAEGYAGPLAGDLLIVGVNARGDTVSPRRTIEDFAASLTIRYPVLSPAFEMLTGPSIFGSRITGFGIALKSATPRILAGADNPDDVIYF